MEKLSAGFEFIFSSYKRASLLLIVIAFMLVSSIGFNVLGPKPQSAVLGATDTKLLAQATGSGNGAVGPNLTVTQVQLRRNAFSAAHPNGNCNDGTVVTEGTTLNPGEVVEVCVLYANNGLGATSTGFKMDNFINRTTQPTIGTAPHQSYPIGAINGSTNTGTQLGSITADPSVCTTNCHAGVFIDSQNVIDETNEYDNFAASVTYNIAATPIRMIGSGFRCVPPLKTQAIVEWEPSAAGGPYTVFYSSTGTPAFTRGPETNATKVEFEVPVENANPFTFKVMDRAGGFGTTSTSGGAAICISPTPPSPPLQCAPRPGCMDGVMDPNSGAIGTCGVVDVPGGYCPNQAPTTTSVTIDPTTAVTDGSTDHKITVTSSDPQGGNTIMRQFALVNYQGDQAGQYRGLVGWSAQGFDKYWGSSYKAGTTPLRCVSGGGAVVIYGGANTEQNYGAQYMNVRWCKTTVSEKTRTTEMYVSFNSNFTSPKSNTLSGFTDDSGGLYDNWKPSSSFILPGANCQYKSKGDANCDNKVNTDDFNIWRSDFLQNWHDADFNGDGKATTDDFNIWRDGFLNAGVPH